MIDYIDTSVLVASHTREARTADINSWLGEQASMELAISDWVIAEFSSALSLKLRTKQIEVADRADALAFFHRLVDESFQVLPADREHFRVAAGFADHHELNIRGGDALHLAIARGEGARLVTLDVRLARAGGSVGISTLLL